MCCIQKVTSSRFFLSTLNYDARSTTRQSTTICNIDTNNSKLVSIDWQISLMSADWKFLKRCEKSLCSQCHSQKIFLFAKQPLLHRNLASHSTLVTLHSTRLDIKALHILPHIVIMSTVKVKWSRYRPGLTQRVDRGVALLLHYRSTRRGVNGQQHAPDALYPRESPGTHFTGGWVGPRAGLDGQKISSPPGVDPGPSSP